jgi:hypothetical protein
MKNGDGYCACGTEPLEMDPNSDGIVINHHCPKCRMPVRKLNFAHIARQGAVELGDVDFTGRGWVNYTDQP